MKILFFKKTTDADLYTGLKVAYKNKEGQYIIGKIEDWYIDNDGYTTYFLAGAAYLADELKLIEPETVNNCEDLKKEVMDKGQFIPITEDLYFEQLGCLPPIWLSNGCFQVPEAVTGGIFYTYGKKGDVYYGCVCNKNFALSNF